MSHSLELIERILDIKKRKLIWNYRSGNLKSWEGSSVNCCFCCRWVWMTPNIWLKIWKKISQSLEVPPYFQICRWLALSARWGSSFIYVFRILQGSCKDAVEKEGKLQGGAVIEYILCAKPCARRLQIHQSTLFVFYITRQKANSISTGVLSLRHTPICL